MGRYFRAAITEEKNGVVTIQIGFGEPAQNSLIVRDAVAEIASLNLAGGQGIKINGPASLPVMVAIAHAVVHLFGFVACYDPKLDKYVVAVSHDPSHKAGD